MDDSRAKRRQQRKFFIVGILLAVMCGSFYVGLSGMNSAQNAAKSLSLASEEAMDLLQLKEQIARQREQILTMMIAKNRAEKKALEEGIHLRTRRIDAILDTFSEMAREDATLSQQLEELKKVRDLSRKTRDELVIPLIYDGKTDEARRLLMGIQQQRYNKMRELSKDITVNAQNKSFVAAAEIGRKSNSAFWTFVATSLLAMSAGIGVVLYLSRSPKNL